MKEGSARLKLKSLYVSTCIKSMKWFPGTDVDHMFEGNANQRSTRVWVHLISRLRSPPWKIWGSLLSAQRWPAPFFFSAPHSAHTPERGRQPWRRRGFDAKTLRSSSDAQTGWPSWSGGEEQAIFCWIMRECVPLELLVELPAQTVHLYRWKWICTCRLRRIRWQLCLGTCLF